jgi:hypothetical protein
LLGAAVCIPNLLRRVTMHGHQGWTQGDLYLELERIALR